MLTGGRIRRIEPRLLESPANALRRRGVSATTIRFKLAGASLEFKAAVIRLVDNGTSVRAQHSEESRTTNICRITRFSGQYGLYCDSWVAAFLSNGGADKITMSLLHEYAVILTVLRCAY